MSFYDDASLVFLAGGAAGKDGKAYSLKPTDGSGDFTFTRGTNLTATRVGKDGYIEKGRENLLLQSNQFDTTWENPSSTLTAGQAGYDGTNDAWLLSKTGSSGLIKQDTDANGLHTYSIYAKAGSLSFLMLRYKNTSTQFDGTYFDLANGELGTTEAAQIIESKITTVGGGWHRCSITFSQALEVVYAYPVNSDGGIANAVTGYIYVQDAQLEQGLVATDYIETGATTATDGLLEDEPRFDYTGGGCPALLIEGNATNLIEHTEYFGAWTEDGTATVTLNQTTSPEGLTNAALLDYGASAGGPDRISTTATITGSTVYAFSVFAKAKDATKIQLRNYHNASYNAEARFDLDAETVIHLSAGADSGTIENYGNGWYRCTLIFTSSSFDTEADLRIGAPSSYSDSGKEIYIYGAQLEANDYSTSYIPNYGAAATASRSYDDPNDVVHGITMGTSCSFFLEATNFKVTETAGPQTSFLQIMDATSPSLNDRFLFAGIGNVGSTFTLQAQNKESGTSTTTNLSKIGLPMGSPFKALARYDGTSFDLFVNGVLEDSDTIVADDHFGRVGLKNLTSQNQNGHSISQVILFDSALSNNDSEIITGATSYSSFADMATSTALNYTIYE